METETVYSESNSAIYGPKHPDSAENSHTGSNKTVLAGVKTLTQRAQAQPFAKCSVMCRKVHWCQTVLRWVVFIPMTQVETGCLHLSALVTEAHNHSVLSQTKG